MIKRALPLLTLAILWLSQGHALAFSALPVVTPVDTRSSAPNPEPLADVRGSRVLRVRAEIKVMPGAELIESALAPLRERYGFVRDQGFAPQALADDKEFSILPYPAQPRPIVFVVKGFVTEASLPQLARDRAVRKVEAEGEPVAPTAESLQRFVAEYAALIESVDGVKSVSVGLDCLSEGEHVHILPHHHVVIVTLEPGVTSAEVRKELREKVPGLAVLPVLFVSSPVEASRGPRKHPGFRPVIQR